VPDGTTEQGQRAFLVVMNPFDVVAVVDVTVYSETRAPIHNSSLMDQEVPPHHSIALELNPVALDEPAAGAEVRASAGRVAVASLGIGDAGGIRSALAVTQEGSFRTLSSTGDAGQSTLTVMSTGEAQVRFGATLLSGRRPATAGGLGSTSQTGRSAHAYPLITDEPSTVLVQTGEGAPAVAVARRVQGRGVDAGSTTGVAAAAPAWVVLPTVAGDPNTPGVVLTNPGSSAVEVTLSLLTPSGTDPKTLQVTVPPTSAMDVPRAFLETDPTAAVLVRASGDVVATGASSSLGKLGVSGFAVAAGVPIPERGTRSP
jgi:hypothetical protein